MTRSTAHGWAVYAAMAALCFAGVFTACWAESQPNPLLHSQAIHIDQHASPLQSGGNMEGKEVRFGIANSALFATVTTDASCGAVNSMHDSFMPLGGLVPMVNIMLGKVIFGGVGAGMYGMLVFVILAVFIAGLMVGRTPEYLGKKIESYDVKMAMLYVLIFPLSILGLTAVSLMTPNLGLAGITNPGPHGLSQILYAYTSATGNNGSAFAGISANTHWYNLSLATAMLVGRFLMIVPMLAVAGNLERKKLIPPSPGTFPVHTPLFTYCSLESFSSSARSPSSPRFRSAHSGAPTPARRQDLLSRKNRNSLMSTSRKRSLWDAKIVRRALIDAFAKLNPRKMMRKPVMFVVEIGSVITTIYLFRGLAAHKNTLGFDLQITLWLWFTVLFANFAEAMAEGRGKAQADALRRQVRDYRCSLSCGRADRRGSELAASFRRPGLRISRRHDPRRWRGCRRRSFCR